MKIKTLALTTCLALLGSNAATQDIVGITQSSPTLVVQEFQGNCLYKRCVPAGFETQVAAHAGGSAYDSRIRGTWVTNGLLLACVDPWGGNCDYICKPQKMPLPPDPTVRHYATGLAYVDSGALNPSGGPGWLFVSYNSGWIARLDVKRCDVQAKFCKISLPSGAVMAGLASDDIHRRLFIGIVLPTAGNLVYVSDVDGNWCQPSCKWQPGPCNSSSPLGRLTGLAFDPCRQTLYITDGLLTGRYAVSAPPQCALRPVGCCKRTGDPFTGLCLLPHRDIHGVGKSCTVASCESCPTMRAELAGDPVLGNPFFGLGLRDAPNKTSTAVLAAGVGPCSAVGVNIGFCEPIRVSLPPVLVFYALPQISTNGCTRNVTLPWAVPLNQGLCGLQISFQWLVVCKGIPTGHGVTNCLDFRFGGS